MRKSGISTLRRRNVGLPEHYPRVILCQPSRIQGVVVYLYDLVSSWLRASFRETEGTLGYLDGKC